MTEFKLPELGENIDQGDLVRLMISPGASVTEGQPVMELETDKAVVEVPSSVSGTVKEIRVKEGEKIKVGQVIFTVENGAGAKVPSAEAKAAAAKPPADDSQGAASRRIRCRHVEDPSTQPAAASAARRRLRNRRDHRCNRIQAARTRREHRSGRSGAPDDLSGREGLRRPAGHGTGDRQGRGRSSFVGDRLVKEIKVKEGEKVKVGQVIFTLEGGASAPAGESRQHCTGRARFRTARRPLAFQLRFRPRARPRSRRCRRTSHSPRRQLSPCRRNWAKWRAPSIAQPVPAAPHVRRLAREIGVDIYEVKGTGPGGRISEDDVKAHAKVAAGCRCRCSASTARRSLRPAAASRLHQVGKGRARLHARRAAQDGRASCAKPGTRFRTSPSRTKPTSPNSNNLRARFAPKAEEAGGKMTVTAIALKVCASALKVFPQFNASIDMAKEEIVYKQYINIGVAVDTDRGLLVPVIRDVDKKNIVELAAELTQLSKKARDKKLTPAEMEGGTFTITNLGGIGGTGFSPIVNYPEVAILGLSRSQHGAGVDERQIRAAAECCRFRFPTIIA